MGRSKRREPLWPVAIVVGVVAAGTALGAIMSGDSSLEGPARALESEEVGGGGAPLPTAESRVRVEILNGGGVPGIAGAARDLLRDEGFDVVYFGNASDFDQQASVIIDRTGRVEVAEAIARSMGLTAVRSEPDTTLLVDVTVLLGTDWEAEKWTGGAAEVLASSSGELEEDAGRAWWDIRRYF